MTGADTGEKCEHCGNVHATTCPRIKAIEYYPDGTVKRITFYSPNDYGPIMSFSGAGSAKEMIR